tara:strand:+ start:496 stop:1524 length:1029 start_codon:yes stop_codon:yes gene_type:complete
MKARAAVLFNSKKPLEVVEIEIPDKISFGQVLVRVCHSGICGAQINEIDAVKGPDKFLPHLLGHEGSGIVERVGEGVKTVKEGDSVVMHWRPSAGIQSATPSYIYKGQKINAGWVTTFNEKAIISENRLTVIPKNFNMKKAPLFGCAITTAFGVINNDAKLKIGQSILVFGLGGVGLNIIQASSMVSANPIIGVDILDEKIILAKKFGLTEGIKYNDSDLNNKLKLFNNNNEFDVVIDTTGKSEIIEKSYELTKKDGKTILVGVPNDKISIYSLPLHFDKVLKGSHGGSSIPDEEIPRYIDLINNGKMTLDNMITHEFDLDDINKAIDLFRTGKCGRIILNI